MCHGPAEARGVTIQDDVDQVVVGQLSIDVKSIDIIQVLLDSTCLPEIAELVESPVQLIVVAIVLLNDLFDLFPEIVPAPASFLPPHCISFHECTNVS